MVLVGLDYYEHISSVKDTMASVRGATCVLIYLPVVIVALFFRPSFTTLIIF